jgi:hypothetical protein
VEYAGHHVDLILLERLIQQPQVHAARIFIQRKVIGFSRPEQSIGARQEFIADAESQPLGRVAAWLKVSYSALDHHRECVVEAQRGIHSIFHRERYSDHLALRLRQPPMPAASALR